MANPNIVSVASIKGGNALFNLTTTLTDSKLTVGSNKIVKINSIIAANVDGTNAADVNVYLNGLGTDQSSDGVTLVSGGSSGGDATGYIAKTISVPADSTLVITDTPFYLLEADELQFSAGAASDIDLLVSFDIISE